MSFKEAITSVFHNYANFSGRARRSEFWYWVLFNTVVASALSGLATMLGRDGQPNTFFNLLSSLYSLAVLVPNLAVSWRRLHDMGKSGGWYFICFVPVVGWILLIVWLAKDSVPGENQYGPNPKESVFTY